MRKIDEIMLSSISNIAVIDLAIIVIILLQIINYERLFCTSHDQNNVLTIRTKYIVSFLIIIFAKLRPFQPFCICFSIFKDL